MSVKRNKAAVRKKKKEAEHLHYMQGLWTKYGNTLKITKTRPMPGEKYISDILKPEVKNEE